MKKMALVLQGGGALGAYEYGAVTAAVDRDWQIVAITGVSIGALTAAAIAGARGKDIKASLKSFWAAITLPANPFLPAAWQASLSLFGNRKFWTPRVDYFNFAGWTSFYDVSPMRDTLNGLCDFQQLNDPSHIRLSVTATDVQSGGQVTFSNMPPPTERASAPVKPTQLTADHFLASGALPPAFQMIAIDGRFYWDGGLFDNTPIQALLDLLAENEIEALPIFVVDLFHTGGPIPTSLEEVEERMLEISFENRFWAQQAGTMGKATEFAAMVATLQSELPQSSAVRSDASFQRLLRLRALKNLHVIEADRFPKDSFRDFSAEGVETRFQIGYDAMTKYLAALGA